jgi:hypothetical protein
LDLDKGSNGLKEERMSVEQIRPGDVEYYGQSLNKITFYPVIEGAYVNTKNWYKEETDMWAEFGRRAPFGRGFSSKHSVEASAIRSTPSFGRRTVPRVKAESIRDCVMTWTGYKERDELMMGTRRT